MEELKKTIRLHCTFCRSELFALPSENYSPPHGSFIVCANCGRENDVTSLVLIAQAKALDLTEKYAEKLIQDLKQDLQEAFKGSNCIKIR